MQIAELDGRLEPMARAVALDQHSPLTRGDYAGIYRQLLAWMGPDAAVGDLTTDAIERYCAHLGRLGRAPSTVAKHRSAVRSLAAQVALPPVPAAAGLL